MFDLFGGSIFSLDFVSESDWLPESEPLPESLLPDWLLLLLEELELEPDADPDAEPDPEPDSSSELLSHVKRQSQKKSVLVMNRFIIHKSYKFDIIV